MTKGRVVVGRTAATEEKVFSSLLALGFSANEQKFDSPGEL
jgi:hypothetical protein